MSARSVTATSWRVAVVFAAVGVLVGPLTSRAGEIWGPPETVVYESLPTDVVVGNNAATLEAERWELVSGGTYTGVVAPLDQAPSFASTFGIATSGGWRPTPEQIAELEDSLPT